MCNVREWMNEDVLYVCCVVRGKIMILKPQRTGFWGEQISTGLPAGLTNMRHTATGQHLQTKQTQTCTIVEQNVVERN